MVVNNIEQLFTCLLVILVSYSEKCLLSPFSIFQLGHLLLLNCKNYFMYSKYKSPIRYLIFLMFSSVLSSHLLVGVF